VDASADPLLEAGARVPEQPEPELAAFRGRLLDGLQRSIEERGYQETTVTDVVRHARASRRTFYLVFSTKDDCFVALMQAANRRLLERIAGAVDPAAPWQTQARAAVEAYFDQVASEPGLSRSWVREFPALGDVAQRVHRDAVAALVELVQRLTDTEQFRAAGLAPVSRELALVVLGGLRELTASVIEDGDDVRGVAEVGVTATLALLATSRAPG
jgi:AcrR family transcriptional regulator